MRADKDAGEHGVDVRVARCNALDGAAWSAAYDYYGHDATGVLYADEVLARAIGWSQHGFCFNCGVDPVMVRAVHGAYGGPMLLATAVADAMGATGVTVRNLDDLDAAAAAIRDRRGPVLIDAKLDPAMISEVTAMVH